MGETALVLSGGGAKGAYEAGVLQAFAEQGVAPRYVVGVSAGAMNGAYAANLIATGTFAPENIVGTMGNLWLHQATLKNLYEASEASEGSTRSLQQLFNRIGIDPFRRVVCMRLGIDPLLALRDLAMGQFISILSHGLALEHLEQYLVPPERVVTPTQLSVAVTNILGTTCLEEKGVCERHADFETFRWDDRMTMADREAQFTWMRQVILASCSVPFVFPPQRLQLTDHDKPGIYTDGGLLESSPIDQAIAMNPAIDTIYLVMAATVVGEPAREPDGFLQILSRIFSMMAGRFMIQNYRRVNQINDQIIRLRTVLDRDRHGQIARNERNQLVCQAAGFRSLEDFLSKRVINLIPISPDQPLRGGIFSGFSHIELRAEYIQQGYLDGLRALTLQRPALGKTAG